MPGHARPTFSRFWSRRMSDKCPRHGPFSHKIDSDISGDAPPGGLGARPQGNVRPSSSNICGTPASTVCGICGARPATGSISVMLAFTDCRLSKEGGGPSFARGGWPVASAVGRGRQWKQVHCSHQAASPTTIGGATVYPALSRSSSTRSTPRVRRRGTFSMTTQVGRHSTMSRYISN
jgi:hypothetical protein